MFEKTNKQNQRIKLLPLQREDALFFPEGSLPSGKKVPFIYQVLLEPLDYILRCPEN